MKYLLPLLLCFSAFAGVGGISGGTDKFQRGSHIHFQSESTFVNVEFNRTLCTKDDEYFAILSKCAIRANDDSNECLKTQKVEAYQPIISERERCESYSSNGTCQRWQRVPFIQSPKRIIEASREFRSKEKRIVVPKCQ